LAESLDNEMDWSANRLSELRLRLEQLELSEVEGSFPSKQYNNELLSFSGLVWTDKLTGDAVRTLRLNKYSRNVLVKDVDESEPSGCSQVVVIKLELDRTSTGLRLRGVIIVSCDRNLGVRDANTEPEAIYIRCALATK
jgi:hypothetical protein